jgi:hypothetical protein
MLRCFANNYDIEVGAALFWLDIQELTQWVYFVLLHCSTFERPCRMTDALHCFVKKEYKLSGGVGLLAGLACQLQPLAGAVYVCSVGR